MRNSQRLTSLRHSLVDRRRKRYVVLEVITNRPLTERELVHGLSNIAGNIVCVPFWSHGTFVQKVEVKRFSRVLAYEKSKKRRTKRSLLR